MVGCEERSAAVPNPRRAIAPGARLCRNTSARDTSDRSTATASGRLRSSVSDSLERLIQTKWLARPLTVAS